MKTTMLQEGLINSPRPDDLPDQDANIHRAVNRIQDLAMHIATQILKL